ncbi:hypothetical protein DL93DRAFT_500161 [Clavulina sp. PMI_390]|nr:hypothetical protein DL93DRAFT_500161 [Clavulina sp. PMI_390]
MLNSSTLIVVHNRTSQAPFIAVRVYDLPEVKATESKSLAPILRRTFLMPEVNESNKFDVAFFLSELEESPKWPPNASMNQSQAETHSMKNAKPFRPTGSEQERLCQIRLTSHGRSGSRRHIHSWRFCFLVDVLLRRYEEDIVPWEQWGASNAACFHGVPTILGPEDDGPVDAMFGSRLARFHSPQSLWDGNISSTDYTNHVIELLDFSKSRFRRRMNPDSWPKLPNAAHSAALPLVEFLPHYDTATGPSTWFINSDPPEVFIEWPLSASLPYVITRFAIPGWKDKDFTQMVMDSERIVLTSLVSSDGPPKMLVITF